ncbi:WD40 repeat domain-containing protein [Shewanella sedimentimangrovi]|uniref:WD-40 repeat protein n=1 Tax=Shewanella sedimentimangrovi TaxID=2814293 RepID=A0ABX7R4W3_9GAMM|nr:hypothetical protein [Shewanella sedimentimangrovi]QSX37868.1 hypothetical protein JYB85_03230 [Shewanella sedimentimangrovi]
MHHILMLLFCTLLLSGCDSGPEAAMTLTQGPSYSATLSADGKLAMVSTDKNGVQLWQLAPLSLKYQWQQDSDSNAVIATALSDNAGYAASLSRESVALWRLSDGSAVGWWSLPSAGQALAVADNGTLLVGLSDGSVMSMAPGQKSLIQFLGHSEKINAVALTANGTLALSAGNDGQAILWQTATGQPLRSIEMDSRVLMVALSPDGTLGFASDSTANAVIWDNQSGALLSKLAIKRRQMTFSSARFSADNTLLMTGTPAREVQVWDSVEGKLVNQWQVTASPKPNIKSAVVYSVAGPLARSHQFISISSNGLVEFWQ